MVWRCGEGVLWGSGGGGEGWGGGVCGGGGERYLQTCYPWWQNQTHVVSVDHGQNANGPCGDPPGVLEGQLLLPGLLRIFKHNVKHAGKVLTQVMGGGTLRGGKEDDKQGGQRRKMIRR